MVFLNESHKMVKKAVKDFSKKEIVPMAAEVDRTAEFPHELHKKMAKMGLIGMIFPSEFGGAAQDTLSWVVAIEELAKVSAMCATLVVSLRASAGFIADWGNEEQKKRYLPSILNGEKISCYALTESGAGSNLAAVKTKAKLNGDKYVVNGTKTFITLGAVGDLAVTLVVTEANRGVHGMSVLVIEEFTKGKTEDLLGIRGLGCCELNFSNVHIPSENLLGKENEGFHMIMQSLDLGRIGVAALSVGLAQAALEESIKYANQREQFGKPISKFQAIEFMIADMATEIEAARLLTHKAALLRDQGKPISYEASQAKLYASDVAMRCATDGLQIHGGYGYTKEYLIERIFRDAKLNQIWEGTNQIQKIIISRKLLGK
jgi:alkylation response protein AidB-like acyl-CoA dehydrogenase